jgi:hypothetical protein
MCECNIEINQKKNKKQKAFNNNQTLKMSAVPPKALGADLFADVFKRADKNGN